MIGLGDFMTREDKVNEFRRAGGKKNYDEAPEDSDMVLDCLYEEFMEFFNAATDYEEEATEETRAQLCKEWADLQYVVSQAAVYYDIPADPSFNRVHESNLSKLVGGKVVLREDGKIMKGPNYVPPDMLGL